MKSFPKRSKHGNKKVVHDGVKFDSIREYDRWCELLIMEKAGVINSLNRQVGYVLVPAVILDGRKKPAIRYFADAVYTKTGDILETIEDSKSPHLRKDKVYRLKKHMMKHFYDIDIVEV